MQFADYTARHRQALFRFAVVLTGDPVLADDVVADVLGSAYERWERVGAADNVHAYVRRMVVNEFLGRRRREVRVDRRTDVADVAPPVSDHADTHAERAAIVAELRQLPPKQRAAVVLRFYEGLPFAEIAAVLGTGENAVRSNVSRALATLRIRMHDSEGARS